MITVEIDSVDVSELIKMGSLTIMDQINQATDTANFTVEKYPSRTFSPALGSEVIITMDDGVNPPSRIYGGVIIEIETDTIGPGHLEYSIKCKDYSQYMDRLLIVDRFDDTNAETVIDTLVADYAAAYGFTTTGVNASGILIKSISFNEITLSGALDKIARLINYVWYVDFYKDIHFFPKNGETAAFDLTDTGGNHIFNSLSLKQDFSQVRNSIKLRGGDVRGISRSEQFLGDGYKTSFALATRFAEMPTVTVAGSPVTVGVEYLQDETLFDWMWSFNEKSLRRVAGALGAAVQGLATGIPLRPLVVEVADGLSIGQYGLYQYYIENDKIENRDEAIRYCIAELQSYSEGIRAGSFSTYRSGLRSGMGILINSSLHDVNERFVIQSVRFKMISRAKYQWDVQIATAKTLSIVDALQMLLVKERLNAGDDETLLKFIQFEDGFSMTDAVGTITSTTTQDYVVEQNVPGSDSYPNPAIVNKSTVSV